MCLDQTTSTSNKNGRNEPEAAIQGSYGNPAGVVTPRESAGRRLTDDEAEMVKHLIGQEMAPVFARAAELGEEVAL